ncbi:MAG: hypothetical protein ACLP6G_05280 [Terriglobales bacterium]
MRIFSHEQAQDMNAEAEVIGVNIAPLSCSSPETASPTGQPIPAVVPGGRARPSHGSLSSISAPALGRRQKPAKLH